MRAPRRCFAVVIAAALLATGCGPPQPTLTDIKLTRNAKNKGYVVTGLLHIPQVDGFYNTYLDATYADGCLEKPKHLDLQWVHAGAPASDQRISYELASKRQIASAHVEIIYSPDSNDSTETVFQTDYVVDPTLHPPAEPPPQCDADAVREETKASKRKHPTAGERLEQLPRNRQVALAINSAGFLCARVTDLYPDSAGQIIAHCTEYLSGRGRVAYRIDPDAGVVTKIE